jgi:hypothetical protein
VLIWDKLPQFDAAGLGAGNCLRAKYLTCLYEGHQVPLIQSGGVELAYGVIGLLDHGDQGGQVLVIADVGLLRDNADSAKNLDFIKNIAHYARAC